MTTQDPKELLKLKHEQDEEKRQFTNFAPAVSADGEDPQRFFLAK
ncbi:hypothetical protein MKZ07_07355 [Paenibacillus sp. FSL P4-0338]